MVMAGDDDGGGNGDDDDGFPRARLSLAALRTLPWRRVDVCFRGAALPLMAHQHLQVQRQWINFAGKAHRQTPGAAVGRNGGAEGGGGLRRGGAAQDARMN